MQRLIVALASLAAIAAASPALAHGGRGSEAAFFADPWVIPSLALAALAYAIGFRSLRRRSGARIASTAALGAAVAGFLVLLGALASPLDALSEQLFAAHMVQHLTLMLVAAPLLVWGRTATILLWAMPRRVRQWGAAGWAGSGLSRILRPALSHPLAVWIWYCGIFVFWHLPGPYGLALENEAVHALEHGLFLLSAFAFWSVVIEPLGRRRLDYGMSVLFVATAAIVSGLPGALMILAPRALYPGHAHGIAAWGFTLLQDQQLGGLIMWVPAGFAYLAAIAALLLLWLREGERRASIGLARAAPLLGLGALLLLGGCGDSGAETVDGVGDARQGAVEITRVGCGACHIIPGIEGARGLIGPPLDHMGRRVYIAGLLRNTPQNMVTWLREPQRIVPGNAMPDMQLSEEQARNIAAYLSTLD